MVALALLALAGCSKELAIGDDDGTGASATGSSTLNVLTRTSATDGSEAQVSYPVNVYVFSTAGKCVAKSVIASAGDELTFKLKKGGYTLYAVGGASEDDYDLPSTDDATPTSAVTLKDGHEHGELMVGTAAVSLAADATNTLTLALKRKVMQVQQVTIDKVSSTVTGVSVTIAPLYAAINLNGEYAGSTGNHTISLARSGEGTWVSSPNQYLLEASGEASITVSMTIGEETKSYTYFTSDELKANYKITITGTYNSNEFDLAGTITGEDWAGTKNITFTFADDDNSVVDPGVTPTLPENAPVVGQLYADNKAFVVDSTDNGNGTITYLLMATTRNMDSNAQKKDKAELKSWLDGIIQGMDTIEETDGWRMPTLSEVSKLKEVQDAYNAYRDTVELKNQIPNSTYAYEDEAGDMAFWELKSNTSSTTIPKTVSFFAFTSITISK